MAVRPRSIAHGCAVFLLVGVIALSGVQDASAEDATAAAAYGWSAADPGMSEEFGGGGAPSPDVWESYSSPGHDGNGLRRPEQNTVQDGYLQIAGLPNATAGGMMSRAVFPAYGRWEVRMRVDKQGEGNPYHAVIALIPHGVPYDGGAGDLDFAESDAGSGVAYAFIHYPPRKQDFAVVPLELADWHTYGIEVAADHISWFVDGNLIMTDTNPDALTGVTWTTNIQLDAYHPSGQAPSNLQVDYFRFFPLPDSGAPTLPGPGPMMGDYRTG